MQLSLEEGRVQRGRYAPPPHPYPFLIYSPRAPRHLLIFLSFSSSLFLLPLSSTPPPSSSSLPPPSPPFLLPPLSRAVHYKMLPIRHRAVASTAAPTRYADALWLRRRRRVTPMRYADGDGDTAQAEKGRPRATL
uniref:Uncharacterized protein n=1 Tax=Ixodes ricinus TaxID=34613 RepID=A0A6B0UTE6_IXORI